MDYVDNFLNRNGSYVGERPAFPEVSTRTPEEVLASDGLGYRDRHVLDSVKDLALVSGRRS